MVEIRKIKECFNLLQQIKGTREVVFVPELARELKVKQTELMQYILDNPKLFYTYNGKKTGKLVIGKIYEFYW